MALAIINKLLHEPTARLREQGGDPGPSRLADAAAELFGLQPGGGQAAPKDTGTPPDVSAVAQRGRQR